MYANAYITIVAASARSCEEGLLQQRGQVPDGPRSVNFNAFSFPYRFLDGTCDEVTLQPLQSFHPAGEPINTRAWTLQENLLSPRLLIYASQLVRECFGSPSHGFGFYHREFVAWRCNAQTTTSGCRVTIVKFWSYESCTAAATVVLERSNQRLLRKEALKYQRQTYRNYGYSSSSKHHRFQRLFM
jgi:hypothetical protein